MALTIDYITTLSSSTDASSYDFGNVSPADDGLLVVVAMGRGAQTGLTSISVGGSSATVWDSTFVTVNTAQNCAAIAGSVVSAGAHNITVNWSGGTSSRCVAGVYLVRGYASTTPFATAISNTGSSGTNITLNLDYPAAGGNAIYGASQVSAATTSWSSASEDSDVSAEIRFAFARRTASGTAVSETITWGATQSMYAIAASWEEAGGGSSRLLLSNAAYFGGRL